MHNAASAGFYAADQNGYYAEEGLSVSFLEGGTNVDYLSQVANGTAQFGTAGADELILARASGKPFQAIATIYRRSPTVFIALANSGINKPQDFVGKTIRIVSTLKPILEAMMANVGITTDQYQEIVLPSDVQRFASGDPPIWATYLTNFVVPVEQAGYKINIIYPDDYGIHFYADSIYTTDSLIASNPDLVLRFLRATLKGYTWAVENPEQVSALVLHFNPNAVAAQETAKMLVEVPLINTGEDHIGWMKPEIWTGMEKVLRDQGVLNSPLDVTKVYTMQFLEEIYK